MNGAYLDYKEDAEDTEENVGTLDQFNKWLIKQKPKFIRIANQMLNVFRENNPNGYMNELRNRQGDWVREFLYEEIDWISEFLKSLK